MLVAVVVVVIIAVLAGVGVVVIVVIVVVVVVAAATIRVKTFGVFVPSIAWILEACVFNKDVNVNVIVIFLGSQISAAQTGTAVAVLLVLCRKVWQSSCQPYPATCVYELQFLHADLETDAKCSAVYSFPSESRSTTQSV